MSKYIYIIIVAILVFGFLVLAQLPYLQKSGKIMYQKIMETIIAKPVTTKENAIEIATKDAGGFLGTWIDTTKKDGMWHIYAWSKSAKPPIYYVLAEKTGKILLKIERWDDATQQAELRNFMQKNSISNYPGAGITNTDATNDSDKIVSGELLDLGEENPEAPGQTYYSNARLLVKEVFLGVGREAQPELEFSYSLQKLPAQPEGDAISHIMRYLTVQKNNTYVFFLKKNGEAWQAVKISDYTEEYRELLRRLPGN